LVLGQYIFPHDHRKFGEGLETVMRNVARLQDGRSADFIYLVDVDQYEQKSNHTSQLVKPTITANIYNNYKLRLQ